MEYKNIPTYAIAFFYIIAFPYPSTMKNEVHNAADRLLEILYMRDIDHPALKSLTLSHKYEAIKLLIANGLISEEVVYLQADKPYRYYCITEEGEKQFESGGFKSKRKSSATAYALIMVAAIAVVVGFALFLFLRS